MRDGASAGANGYSGHHEIAEAVMDSQTSATGFAHFTATDAVQSLQQTEE